MKNQNSWKLKKLLNLEDTIVMKKMNNIYKTINGTYRVRKYVDGIRMSRNFTTIKAAKE